MGIKKDKSGEYEYGKRDLFAAVIAMKLVQSADQFAKTAKEIGKEIDLLDRGLKTISIDKVLAAMGFPSDWKLVLKVGKKR